MKYLYTLILLATCTINFAQSDLFVSNGSYVYVDGSAFTSGPTVAPLFVTNDVNLDSDGFIYLRNDAQLIQSNGTIASTNTGVGQLSVYQTGTSNTYMYNYWGSPVGINSGVAGNTVFTPNVNLYDPIGNANAHLNKITSLLANYTNGYDGTATIPNTTQQTISEYWLYQYIGVTAAPDEYYDWIGIGGGSLPTGGVQSGQLASGYGFTMKGNPSSLQKYDFRGRPNNGTISNITINAGLETLVGNPYPSAIDAREFLHGATANNQAVLDPTGTLSFWEQDPLQSTSHVLRNYVGGYATYTISSGGTVGTYTPTTFHTYNNNGNIVTSPSITSDKNVYRYIPIGQGFMVRGGTGGVVEFTNDMRIFQKQVDPESQFFKTTNNESRTGEGPFYNEDSLCIMPEGYKRFRLNLDFNETYTRQLTQTFHSSATIGLDYGLETRSPEALNSDAYWPVNDVKLNAQALAFNEGLNIPLVINISQNQPFRFRIFDVQNFDESQPIFIHDIENNIYVNLKENNYEINLPQGTYTDRFEITFTAETLNMEQVITADDLNIYQNNQLSQLSISNPKLLEVKQVKLYDISGKQILDERNLKTEAKYIFSTKNLSEGVYIANVTFADNQIVSKKIIVSNK
ncbi:T9SS sorting signal type C domain-containing protein [Bizionia arctica]|uniref:T9SS C-terminal target domain-containing protein n=1 Tax=Bizionia arctica TaxID=1495645 RepID=A0A917GKZ5_9FLAO|nr:T9SS sorting signal type C domain-containing protein [Bizionia arctica]GGG50357.1 T9SS C-terminal target domain-containing protein [Bizionia arctica]